jgi:non-homologous end joining protein Ku
MKGDNHLLAITTKTVTPKQDPSLSKGEKRIEPLFAFPVQVCKATESSKSKFDIAAPSGAERKQVYLDTSTGEIVEDSECPRGVRIGDEFRAIPTEAITEAKGQKSNMIVALGKIDLDQIDLTRADGVYFVQSPAKGGSAKAYRLTYEALLADKKALVVKRTPRTNEKLAVIYAHPEFKCLVLEQLVFASDVRDPDDQVLSHLTAQVEQEQIDQVRKVIAGLSDGDEVLATAKDDNLERIDALLEKAVEGEAITAPTPIAETVESDDLTAMLEASLAAV